MKPYSICFAMRKGGAGKTTVCVNTAVALAVHYNKRVLVVDCDIQCNSTQTLIGQSIVDPPTVKDVFWHGMPMEEARRVTRFSENLFVVPGDKALEEAEKAAWLPTGLVVARARSEIPLTLPDDVDYVFWDLPPTLGLWTQAAFAVCDSVIAVTEPESYAYEGVQDLQAAIRASQMTINPDLDVTGIIVDNLITRRGGHAAWLEGYRRTYGDLVFPDAIPSAAAISDSQTERVPVEFYRSRNAAAAREAFRATAGTLIERTASRMEAA